MTQTATPRPVSPPLAAAALRAPRPYIDALNSVAGRYGLSASSFLRMAVVAFARTAWELPDDQRDLLLEMGSQMQIRRPQSTRREASPAIGEAGDD